MQRQDNSCIPIQSQKKKVTCYDRCNQLSTYYSDVVFNTMAQRSKRTIIEIGRKLETKQYREVQAGCISCCDLIEYMHSM